MQLRSQITNKLFYYLLFWFLLNSINWAQDEVQQWLEKENKQLEKYISEQDAQFIEFLKKEWIYIPVKQGLEFYEAPKPEEAPVYNPDKIPDTKTPDIIQPIKKDDEEPVKIPDEIPKEEENQIKPEEETGAVLPDQEEEANTPEDEIEFKVPAEDVEPITTGEDEEQFIRDEDFEDEENGNDVIEEPDKKVKNEPAAEISPAALVHIDTDFFTVYNEFLVPENARIELDEIVDNEAIVKFWEQMAKVHNEQLVRQLKTVNNKMQLNDWGYCLLLNKLGGELYPNSINGKYLFTWFMLSKTGYQAKVGTVGNKVYLLLPSKNKLFGIPFFRLSEEDKRLYVINFENLYCKIDGELYTYEGNYPGSNKLLDMNVYTAPSINPAMINKKYTFYYNGEKYELSVDYNEGTIDYYRDYPYSNLEVYFNSSVENRTKTNLLNSLKPLIKDKDELSAANIILRFCQSAFDYKTDQPNFGREKPLFPEETLHYQYSDCEDRSIMFAFLIKELLGLEVIGLIFPGHVATAVKFNKAVKGDAVTYRGKELIICDPTYINAHVGTSMPEFRNIEPEEFIILN